MIRQGTGLIAVLVVLLVMAGSAVHGQSVIWEHWYGGDLDDVAWKVVQTPDSGFFLCGDQSTGPWRAALARVEQDGSLAWLRLFGDSVVAGGFSGMVLMPDSGVIAVGSGRPAGGSGRNYIARFDKDGNLTWDAAHPGQGVSYRVVGLLNNGNVVTTGDTFPAGRRCSFVHRLSSSDGSIISSMLLDSCKYGYDILGTRDGGWVVVGEHATGSACYVGKFTAGGSKSWETKVKVTGVTTLGKSVIELGASGFMIAGHGHAAMLSHVTSQGVEDWTLTYHGGGCRAEGICRAWDGGFILSGSKEQQAFVMKVDDAGTEEWTTDFGTSSIDNGYDVIRTLDSNYVVAGISAESGTDDDMYFVKIAGPPGIEEQSHFGPRPAMRVEPNPSGGSVSFVAPFAGTAALYDASGRMATGPGRMVFKSGQSVSYRADVVNGTYLLVLRADDGRVATAPLVVMK